jgi:hypothetical protein
MPIPSELFFSILFSLIGSAVFLYGKNSKQIPPLLIGLTLMVFPYFVSGPWLIFIIGCALCGAVYVFRE